MIENKDYDRAKHLEMLEGIIARVANNSFMLKGWAVTLVTAIFALTINLEEVIDYKRTILLVITLLPPVSMWLLDTYYLFKERQFRYLYTNICNSDICNYEIKIKMSSWNSVKLWIKCFISPTELLFYVPLIIISIVLITLK